MRQNFGFQWVLIMPDRHYHRFSLLLHLNAPQYFVPVVPSIKDVFLISYVDTSVSLRHVLGLI
jgi:hypothetical protein